MTFLPYFLLSVNVLGSRAALPYLVGPIFRQNYANCSGWVENNMLKWYVHVLCMGDNRWPKRILTWSLEGRRRGRPKIKWDSEVKRVMKQKNLTSKRCNNLVNIAKSNKDSVY